PRGARPCGRPEGIDPERGDHMTAPSAETPTQTALVAARALAHRPILATLEEKIAPGHTALVVVDVQNDFCAEGGMMDREGNDLSAVQEMAGALPALLEAARRAGVLVVFVRNV